MPRKLGQHFLRSSSVIEKLCETVQKNDVVVEIGPGKGALTSRLLEKGAKLIAIETDTTLIPFLQEKFASEIESGQFTLFHEDILEWDIPNNLGSYKVIANIPYYITGAIIRTFLEKTENNPTSMTLLVQREIADRATEKNSKSSIFSLSMQAYGKVRKLMNVKKEAFSPPPKVGSAILEISLISKDFFTKNNITERNFFTIVRGAFAQKRKTLINNLKNTFSDINWKEIFIKHDISLTIRAEEIPLQTWIVLTQESTKSSNI